MDLVEVRFPGPGRTVFVQPGTSLIEAAGMAGVDLATGCRRGMCGTDAVRVACEHGAVLEPADGSEAGTLARMGLGPDCRLACSARVHSGVVTVLGDAIA